MFENITYELADENYLDAQNYIKELLYSPDYKLLLKILCDHFAPEKPKYAAFLIETLRDLAKTEQDQQKRVYLYQMSDEVAKEYHTEGV